ncbi:hypothetical protein HSX11_08475 [Oxalobacteraceae bacterium]|nr:hypothetical protein [Oxalobacteraceae bacterium]
MEPDDAAAVQALRQQLASRFATMAQDGNTPLSELRELRDRLALLDAAANDPGQTARRRRRRMTIAALLVATVLSLAALIPMPQVPFSLEAEASAARLEVDDKGILGPQALAGRLRVDGYSALESPDMALNHQQGAQSGQLVLTAPSLNLRRIRYPAGAAIELAASTSGPTVTIHSPQAPVELEAEFSGLTTTQFASAGSARTADYPVAEWLRVRGVAQAGQAPPPMMVVLPRPGAVTSPPPVQNEARSEAQSDYLWTGLRPRQVRFVERLQGADAEVVVLSSLSKAHIQLQAKADEVQLGPGEELELGGLELQRCEVRLGQVLRISMTGTARTLQTRTGQFARSLKPSLLEYAARHKKVALLWSAAVFIWGIVQWLQRFAATGD